MCTCNVYIYKDCLSVVKKQKYIFYFRTNVQIGFRFLVSGIRKCLLSFYNFKFHGSLTIIKKNYNLFSKENILERSLKKKNLSEKIIT